VHEPPGLGSYPPDSYWRFPPPPVSRAWLFAAIAAGILCLLAFGAGATYLALGAGRDIPGFIDNQRVLDLASRECRLMTSTVEGLPFDGTPSERLDALDDQSAAVTRMVVHIRSVGRKTVKSDRPLDSWLADWEALVASRQAYLGKQRSGVNADFRLPRTPNGDPITERMNVAGEDICTVPGVLLHPDLAGARGA
jgi:hypothetical protein